MTFRRSGRRVFHQFFILVAFLLVNYQTACQSQAPESLVPVENSPTAGIVIVTGVGVPTNAPSPTGSPTASPTASPSPIPTLFPLPTLDPEATLVSCDQRSPAAQDLLSEVNASYGLDPNYVPGDLVKLGDYLPGRVTLPDMLLRSEPAQALGRMVKTMLADGLSPTVLSSYRSYFEQAVAHQRWVVDDPANADLISALPGHSEHQLGTAVDFGSPEMPALTGSTTDKFSPAFAQTSEGRWLMTHAYEYGFSQTSPAGAEALTGLTYEPWHYRYVGVELASYLHTSGYFLDEYLLKVRPVMPCLP
jgi:D-alanyl-D-alanine carboxypeptidase